MLEQRQTLKQTRFKDFFEDLIVSLKWDDRKLVNDVGRHARKLNLFNKGCSKVKKNFFSRGCSVSET